MDIAVLAAIFVLFFGPRIIRLWVGEENYVGDRVLYIFCAIMVTSLIVQVSATLLTGTGKHAPIAYLGLLEAALNLGLSIIFVRYWGVLGVAMGTILSGVPTNLWFSLWYACRVLEIKARHVVARCIAPAVLYGAAHTALYFLLVRLVFPDRTLLAVAAGALCCCSYLFSVSLFFRKEEYRWLWAIVRSGFAAFRGRRES